MKALFIRKLRDALVLCSNYGPIAGALALPQGQQGGVSLGLGAGLLQLGDRTSRLSVGLGRLLADALKMTPAAPDDSGHDGDGRPRREPQKQ